MARLDILSVSTKLVVETCCNCGVTFAMSEELFDRKQSDKTSFYCPNGHGQHYTGKTDEQRREDAEREAANAREDARIALAEAAQARRSLASLKREKAAAERRAHAALCPVEGCQRSFVQLARHMKAKHPEYVAHNH